MQRSEEQQHAKSREQPAAGRVFQNPELEVDLPSGVPVQRRGDERQRKAERDDRDHPGREAERKLQEQEDGALPRGGILEYGAKPLPGSLSASLAQQHRERLAEKPL